MRNLIELVRTRRDLCIISDKHSGLLRGVPSILPHNAHRYCLRRLRENFKMILRTIGIQAVEFMCDKMYTMSTTDLWNSFVQHIRDIATVHSDAHRWLEDKGFEKLTFVHDGSFKYGTMTTNASECFNGILKCAVDLPIQALVCATYYHTVGLFLK
ncbi:hypothetical protein AXF42_Ash001167 [Apostasia shenzhenica]|uniref:Uncharacterized protein n=1 Tax=Apostasia shenzhenica TaxID=1088818 RepID=A0A2I0AU54_9ASPA|nr:hypothetical protein AXF42_Ash001167 [Apostasia shenzhenica]